MVTWPFLVTVVVANTETSTAELCSGLRRLRVFRVGSLSSWVLSLKP
jgi:hypothetical protein